MARERKPHVSDFYYVFNRNTEKGRGCSLILFNTICAHFGNAIITGALYTAFLAQNGIDIVRVGVISFIPYLSWILSVLSPMVLSHFRRRKKLLIFNTVFYHGTIVLATTIMPLFVQGTTAKTVWFAVLLFLGNASNALLGSAGTAWSLRFIPKGLELNVFTAYNNIAYLVCSNATGLIASFAATLLEASGHQRWFIFWLRIAAFAIMLLGSLPMYLIPSDEPVELPDQKVNPLKVITEPIRYKPFLLTAMIPVLWGITCGFNSSTYSYFLLETVKIPIIFQYTGALTSVIGSIFLSNFFRRMADKTSPYFMVQFFLFGYTILQALSVFVGPGQEILYIIVSALSGLNLVGYCMGYNSLFYLNLPKNVNVDLFSTFWNLVANFSIFIGSAVSTWILAVLESYGTFRIAGMEFYSSQLMCAMKTVIFAGMLLFVMRVSPRLQQAAKENM